MKQYRVNRFEKLEEIKMEDIEQFYTTMLRRKDGYMITLTAPLLVCMALQGEVDSIISLLDKFPLAYKDGWTAELLEHNTYQRESYLYMCKPESDGSFDSLETMTVVMALAFAENVTKEDYYRMYKLQPWGKREMHWIKDNADEATKNKMMYYWYSFKGKNRGDELDG